MSRHFTQRELKAIEEALVSRLAGEIDIEDDPDSPDRESYENALHKVWERIKN